jgi:hypothetical protein
MPQHRTIRFRTSAGVSAETNFVFHDGGPCGRSSAEYSQGVNGRFRGVSPQGNGLCGKTSWLHLPIAPSPQRKINRQFMEIPHASHYAIKNGRDP